MNVNFDPVILEILTFEIRWYGVLYAISVLLCTFLLRKIDSRVDNSDRVNIKDGSSDFKINTPKISEVMTFDQIAFHTFLTVVIGGRLGYMLFYDTESILNDFCEIFKIWKGGMSFHGGVIGLIVGNYILSKKYQISFYRISDLYSVVTPVAIFIMRIANFINSELYGRVTDMPWGVVFTQIDTFTRHPSQLYEAFFEGIVLFIIMLLLYYKTNIVKRHGVTSVVFCILYSIFRFLLEDYREPDIHIGFVFYGLTMGQILSICMFLFGLIISFCI